MPSVLGKKEFLLCLQGQYFNAREAKIVRVSSSKERVLEASFIENCVVGCLLMLDMFIYTYKALFLSVHPWHNHIIVIMYLKIDTTLEKGESSKINYKRKRCPKFQLKKWLKLNFCLFFN